MSLAMVPIVTAAENVKAPKVTTAGRSAIIADRSEANLETLIGINLERLSIIAGSFWRC